MLILLAQAAPGGAAASPADEPWVGTWRARDGRRIVIGPRDAVSGRGPYTVRMPTGQTYRHDYEVLDVHTGPSTVRAKIYLAGPPAKVLDQRWEVTADRKRLICRSLWLGLPLAKTLYIQDAMTETLEKSPDR